MSDSSSLKKRLTRLSLGTAGFGRLYGAELDQQCANDVVRAVLRAGIKLIDTAPWYWDSERILGQALQASQVERDKYIIATKVGRYRCLESDIGEFDFSRDRIRSSVRNSLKLLQTSYLDIVYLHDIEFVDSRVILKVALPALQELKSEGLLHNIGVCGYPLQALDELIQASDCIDLVQSYCHANLQNEALLPHAERWSSKGIVVLNAAPLAMGLLTASGPQHWHPASEKLRKVCRNVVAKAEDEGIDMASVAVWYSVHLSLKSKGAIASTVIGCVSAEQVQHTVAAACSTPPCSVVDMITNAIGECRHCSWPSGSFPATKHTV